MYGAILGDIIGSPYEFDKSPKTKDFPLFIPRSRYTDDSMMTIAVAEALLALLSAAYTYSPQGKAGFRTYANVCMQNRLRSVLRAEAAEKNCFCCMAGDVTEA